MIFYKPLCLVLALAAAMPSVNGIFFDKGEKTVHVMHKVPYPVHIYKQVPIKVPVPVPVYTKPIIKTVKVPVKVPVKVSLATAPRSFI